MRLGVTAVRLLAKPEGELLGANRRPRLTGLHLEPLALASGRISAHAEHGLEILPARLVGRDDRDLGCCVRIGHAQTVPPDRADPGLVYSTRSRKARTRSVSSLAADSS